MFAKPMRPMTSAWFGATNTEIQTFATLRSRFKYHFEGHPTGIAYSNPEAQVATARVRYKPNSLFNLRVIAKYSLRE